ncbi:unnamed protein product [Cylindrotheca closterium]|uniref:DUF6824 domain-containing protein n=1 Tax=Cylindrotheca closterium TaxID=2856 RepID=A0AAD2FFT4_9STRA|nr:unnamed protein product [Cylindrotheca closterium]
MATPSDQVAGLLSCLMGGAPDADSCFIRHHQQANVHDLRGKPGDSQLQTMGQTDEFLTPEFNKLSIQQQSVALEDLHNAVSELQEEDPAMIDKLLADLQQELDQGNYPIYELALSQDRSYVEDPAFRLMFLRANMHDVRKSAKQIISFLQHKSMYFGNDKVASDITVDDLTPEELELMLSGLYHVQDDTDCNGRVIFYWFNKVTFDFSAEAMIRVNYYVWFNILIPIHAVQKKGILSIFYDIMEPGESYVNPGMTSLMQIFNFMHCLPIRYSGLHYCLKLRKGNLIAWNKLFLEIAVKSSPKYARERSRVHYGSDVELQYKLANYGIPLDTLPVDVNGNLKESILNVWLHNHLAKERSLKTRYRSAKNNGPLFPEDEDGNLTSSSSGGDGEGGANRANNNVASINSVQDGIWETDVLFGRGRLVQYHPGNMQFREFLGEHREEYESLSRNQRRKACVDLTNELIGNGTRFLKQGADDEWMPCDFEVAVDKVSQFYRTRRRRIKEDGNL